MTSNQHVSNERLEELIDFFEYRYTGRDTPTGENTLALLGELQQRRTVPETARFRTALQRISAHAHSDPQLPSDSLTAGFWEGVARGLSLIAKKALSDAPPVETQSAASNRVSTEQQRKEAFAVFLAALDARDIPLSMAFQSGWDACMRRERPAVETTTRQPEKPVAWYRWGGSALRPIIAWGDWPPPEPDDTAWYPLYSSPEGRPAVEPTQRRLAGTLNVATGEVTPVSYDADDADEEANQMGLDALKEQDDTWLAEYPDAQSQVKPTPSRCHFMAFRDPQFQCTKPRGHDGSHSCGTQPETQPLKASGEPFAHTAHLATCQGGSGGRCCDPDCETCWPDSP